MGTPKARLDDPRPFDDSDLILFFCGSKAGEERACAEMAELIRDLDGDPETAAVSLLTWVIMPRATKLLYPWLYAPRDR